MRRRSQRGMVTAEFAVGLLTAGLAATLACWVVMLVALQARCADVAGQVARQVARADDEAAAEAKRRVPDGGTVQVSKGQREVRVVVQASRSWGPIGPVRLEGRAVADLEPGTQK